MSTLVGKKFQRHMTIEVLQELGNNEILCKFTNLANGKQHGVIAASALEKHWKEIREPRVVYINEYDNTALYHGLSDYSFKTEALARQWNVKGYIATRKFIEVLE